MFLFKWIYVLGCLVCANAFSASNNEVKQSKNERPQRKNSKRLEGFPDPRRPLKDFNRLDKFLRTYLKENKTSDFGDVPDDLESKIINGREAEPGEYPWMVALYFSDRFICSAFLVAPTIVVTAAHCVEYEEGVEPASSFYGIVGTTNRQEIEKKIEFEEVLTHPDFGTSGSEGDIAILRTTEPLEYSDWIQPICLPRPDRDFDLEYVQAMGWGITSNDADGAPDQLMTTELAAQPRSLCQLVYAFMLISITERHICASANTATGVCFGDSGGPLVLEDIQTGRPLAIGIASFVTFLGCGRPMVPGVYTSTSAFSDWVSQSVGENSGICFV